MSAADTTTLSVVRAVSTVGLGVLTGLTASVSLWTFPAVYEAPTLSPRDRLHLWSKLFDHGFSTVKIVAPIVVSSLALSAYLATPPPLWLGANFIARHRKGVFGAIAALTVASPLYTKFFMLEKINSLKKIEADIVRDPVNENGNHETDTVIQTWLNQHQIRILLASSAFLLSVAELIAA